MRILIGLGANLGDPTAAFRRAIAEICNRHSVHKTSSLYRTRAVGPPQPEYLNMVIEAEVKSTPHELLKLCLELEVEAGRERENEERWGPRALDLDLLLAEELVVRSPLLQLPHPQFHERAFALAPAAEIAPGWIHPIIGKTLVDLATEAQSKDPEAILKILPFQLS